MVKAMPNKIDNIYKEIWSLYHVSRLVRTAHFLAAQENQRIYKVLGTGVILINVLIFSPLFDLLAPGRTLTIIIKVLAIVAASLAGLQTLFNFQKNSEAHLSAGNTYGTINRRIKILIAEYQDQLKDPAEVTSEFRKLSEDYLQANRDYKGNIPTEKQFDKARRSIKRGEEKRETDKDIQDRLRARL